MIKDTQQKIKAVRYCVALGIVPHLEVVVRYAADTSDSPADITDIDVLGMRPCTDAGIVRIIFDCKTLSKMSAINRALWAKGLMALTNSNEAFVILSKEAPEAHRLAGNSFDVRLFSERGFDSFAESAAKDYLVPNSYIENLQAWERLFSFTKNYPPLHDTIKYLGSTALLQINAAQGIRGLMSQMKQAAGEFDPSKDTHRAVFKLALSQFTMFICVMVRDFQNIFDPQADKMRFEKTLRYYIWGGRENYELRQRLNVALKAAKGVADSEPFEFPAWDRFVELFRAYLDAPLTIGAMCLPIKDMAFRELTDAKEDLERRLTARWKTNNRNRQFAIMASTYFIEAIKLPREFRDDFVNDLNRLIA